MTAVKAMAECGVKKTTFYKLVKEYEKNYKKITIYMIKNGPCHSSKEGIDQELLVNQSLYLDLSKDKRNKKINVN